MQRLEKDKKNLYNLHYYDKKLYFGKNTLEHNNHYKNKKKETINYFSKVNEDCNIAISTAQQSIGLGFIKRFGFDRKNLLNINGSFDKFLVPKFVNITSFNNLSKITVFIDKYLLHAEKVKSKIKIALTKETKTINSTAYKYLLDDKNAKKFDIILTHHYDLLKKYPDIAYFFPNDPPTIELESLKLHQKNKLCSFLLSDKSHLTSNIKGYNLRTIIKDSIENNKMNIEILKNIKKKSDSLNDYMFTIICLNSDYDYCFCDQILDPFCTGTIPIYFGSKLFKLFFDEKGALYFDNINDFIKIYKNKINKKYYYDNMEAIKYNYEKVKQFYDYDDNILEVVRLHYSK